MNASSYKSVWLNKIMTLNASRIWQGRNVKRKILSKMPKRLRSLARSVKLMLILDVNKKQLMRKKRKKLGSGDVRKVFKKLMTRSLLRKSLKKTKKIALLKNLRKSSCSVNT